MITINIFAQNYYGQIIYIYKTDKSREELDKIFSPKTDWIDITNRNDIKIGYVLITIDGQEKWVDPESEEYLQYKEGDLMNGN